MESKLLAGGKNIIDRTDEQKRVLEKRRQEMIEQKVYRLWPVYAFISFVHTCYFTTEILLMKLCVLLPYCILYCAYKSYPAFPGCPTK